MQSFNILVLDQKIYKVFKALLVRPPLENVHALDVLPLLKPQINLLLVVEQKVEVVQLLDDERLGLPAAVLHKSFKTLKKILQL